MGRRPQPEIRQRLLDACTDYALVHGLPDRLAPLARASGASPRMLLYHFGTRDDLLRAVLRNARSRQLDLFGELLLPRDAEPYSDTLRRAWSAMTRSAGKPYVDMFGPLRDGSTPQLWPDFRRVATTDWLTPLERGLGSIGRPELATLVLAVFRGLLVDLVATGDLERADRAFEQFVRTLRPRSLDRAPA